MIFNRKVDRNCKCSVKDFESIAQFTSRLETAHYVTWCIESALGFMAFSWQKCLKMRNIMLDLDSAFFLHPEFSTSLKHLCFGFSLPGATSDSSALAHRKRLFLEILKNYCYRLFFSIPFWMYSCQYRKSDQLWAQSLQNGIV